MSDDSPIPDDGVYPLTVPERFKDNDNVSLGSDGVVYADGEIVWPPRRSDLIYSDDGRAFDPDSGEEVFPSEGGVNGDS